VLNEIKDLRSLFQNFGYLFSEAIICGGEANVTLKNQNMWTAVLFLIGTALQVGGFQSTWLAYMCFALSGGLLLFSLIHSLRVPGGFLPKWDAWWSLRLGGKLALPDAARIAYEAARKNKTLWAEAAERLGVDNTPAGILDYVATYFGMHVPIIGKRPPSTVDEMIDMKQAGKGTFEGGATRLEMNDGHTVFTDLRVCAKDVKLVVKKLSEKVFPDGRA